MARLLPKVAKLITSGNLLCLVLGVIRENRVDTAVLFYWRETQKVGRVIGSFGGKGEQRSTRSGILFIYNEKSELVK